jgi:acyl-CoA thioester hydrolase
MFNHAIEVERRAPGQRWLIVSVALEYIAEAHFPEHVEIASGILRIGRSSWDIASAAFQGGECKATCITTIVLTDATGPTPLPQELRAEFERLHVKTA